MGTITVQDRIEEHEKRLVDLKEVAKRFPRAESQCIAKGVYAFVCDEAFAEATDFAVLPWDDPERFTLCPYVQIGSVRVYGSHNWMFGTSAAVVFMRMRELKPDLYAQVLSFLKSQA